MRIYAGPEFTYRMDTTRFLRYFCLRCCAQRLGDTFIPFILPPPSNTLLTACHCLFAHRPGGCRLQLCVALRLVQCSMRCVNATAHTAMSSRSPTSSRALTRSSQTAPQPSCQRARPPMRRLRRQRTTLGADGRQTATRGSPSHRALRRGCLSSTPSSSRSGAYE